MSIVLANPMKEEVAQVRLAKRNTSLNQTRRRESVASSAYVLCSQGRNPHKYEKTCSNPFPSTHFCSLGWWNRRNYWRVVIHGNC